MITYIEQRFKQIAENTGNAILEAQWEYDKQLIPEALKAIATIFPHYSVHDESHSISILNNIVNVLGTEAIDRFSCIDLWLLLEAAYCHDIGMVVTADMITKAIEDGSFSRYVERIMNDSSHPLYSYSLLFELYDGILTYKDKTRVFQSYVAVKFLLSGYFRSYHAANSSDVVKQPEQKLSLKSPRVIIPSRLYLVLGGICDAHARFFNDVLKLPFVENGLATEKSHPRFLACLLRIGDLLDIDNNRFSETALRTVSSIPYDSILHWEKHCSITHIRIDNKHIELTAKCPNPQVAKITNEWFDLIVDEFNDQTIRWNNIAPDKYGCYLPTLGNLQVEIDGYENFKSTEMPKFTINTAKALDLLQGQNLYQSPFESIREIIQNAVDSTLIRYFLEKETTSDMPDGINQSLLEHLKAFPINITTEDHEKDYLITISDSGIGLKREHLKYLSNTGNSFNNQEKKNIVKRMPDWLRPSGTFGIGFQSIFLLTDCVEVETKDFFTDECYAMEMYKPSSRMSGDIYVKRCKHLTHSGLKIKFKLDPDIVERTLYKDPFNAVSDVDVFYMVKKQIQEYGETSLVPIVLNNQLIERIQFDYYDSETGIELKLLSRNGMELNRVSELYFKNARVGSSFDIKFLHPIVNLHKGSANSILSLNRNSVNSDYRSTLNQNVVKTVCNCLEKSKLENLPVINLLALSAFIKFYNVNQEECKINNIFDLSTMDINIHTDKFFGIEDLCSAPKIRFRTITPISSIKCETEDDGTICVEANIFNVLTYSLFADLASMIFLLLANTFPNCYLNEMIKYQVFWGGEYIFTRDVTDYNTNITEDKLNSNLFAVSDKRLFIPYINGYDDLVIPSSVETYQNIKIHIGGFETPSNKIAKILSPFLIINNVAKDARTKEFYEYVHKLNGKPMDKIISSYDRLVRCCVEKNLVKLE